MAPRSSLPSSSKKRKHAGSSDEEKLLAKITTLEARLIDAVTSKSSLNPLADLLDVAYNTLEAQALSKTIWALYRVFVVVISNDLLLNIVGSEESKVVRIWLQEKLNSYVKLLVGLMKDDDGTLKTSALKILLSLQKHLSTSVSKAPGSSNAARPQFHTSHFRQIVYGLLLCPASPRSVGKLDPDVRDLFMESWLSEYDDLRWFFLRESAGLLSTYSRNQYPHAAENLLSLLEKLTTFPTEASELNKWWVEEFAARPPKPKTRSAEDEDDVGEDPDASPDDADTADDWRKFFDEPSEKDLKSEQKAPSARLHKLTIHQSLYSLSSHKAIFTRAWLALLPAISAGPMEDTKTLATRVLNVMHRGVMPHLTRAVLVMDWVASCVDYGGTVGLLALNALFILMKEYNLDYPSFYTRLYSFLDRNLFHLKHRARFFRMTELFLSSTHLPVSLLASFVKRLAQLSLHAPPAAIVMIIPFTYNILKRHPALMVMIHRIDETYEATNDPFNASEPNPTLTNALDSSLWELHTQKSHYHAAVSTLARIFEEAFTKPNYTLEDFLDHTYSTMYETEARRRIKKEPAFAFDLPQRTWLPSNTNEGAEEDHITSLWKFS
ncbi:ribosome biogenesis protein Noc4 [Irpex rosettiformis]|uniref:Ribosome biogenesis protein Noc4 n=1 Tax=Irpex rosettiformis TaxID=378272 RepID=A0ACB8UBN3_9APHY|nr:ribosome biogenesis protein Noc4 [Irpex rosettiformis]